MKSSLSLARTQKIRQSGSGSLTKFGQARNDKNVRSITAASFGDDVLVLVRFGVLGYRGRFID